ncbi:MAG: alpha-galactosidase [Firmicutes bacterium]|nr:alpha-galactosidase [Bacillota bacterium]
MEEKRAIAIREHGAKLVIDNGCLAITYDLKHGAWSVSSVEEGSFSAGALFARAEVDGEWAETSGRPVDRWDSEVFTDTLGKGVRVEFRYVLPTGLPSLSVVMRLYEDRPSVFLELRLRNCTDKSLRIGGVRPLEMESGHGGALYLGEDLGLAKVYRESNNMRAPVVRDLEDFKLEGQEPGNPFASGEEAGKSGESSHESGWMGLIFNPRSKTSFLGGFVSVDVALGKVVTRYQSNTGITQWYATCKYDGLEIEPGRELVSETLYVDVRPDPFESLETFADVVAAENNLPPILETPALWCSWYPYRLKLNEEEVLKNARVVADRFRDCYGVKVMQLDYGWNHKDTPGDWWNNQDRFPHGLEWLGGQLRSMGLELGIWVGPFIVFEGSEFFQTHPECAIKDHDGQPSKWARPWPWEPKQDIYDLDLRNPESRDFLRRVFRRFVSLGIKYFKLDFLNGPSTAPLSFTFGIKDEDRLRDGERMRIGLSLIRETVGDDAYLLACNLPHSHALGIASAVFAAIDVGNSYFDREEGWKHFRSRSSGLISRYYQQKKLWLNDPDVIYVGGNPPDFDPVPSPGEARLRTTVVALSGGPVLLGDNLARLPEDRLNMYTLCLPAYGVSARPVDLFTSDYPRIWDLKVRSSWGSWDVVGLFNYEAQEASIPVDLAALGLTAEEGYLVWEFWEQRFLGTQSSRIEVSVPARDVRLILLKPLLQTPGILSTSFHLIQGAVELSDVEWDSRKRTLSGKCHRHPGARGDLFVYVPEGYRIDGFDVEGGSEGSLLPVAEAGGKVWRLALPFQGRTVGWRIGFGI